MQPEPAISLAYVGLTVVATCAHGGEGGGACVERVREVRGLQSCGQPFGELRTALFCQPSFAGPTGAGTASKHTLHDGIPPPTAGQMCAV
eukprot:39706-Chlamydomonas_euryale.AAC.1